MYINESIIGLTDEHGTSIIPSTKAQLEIPEGIARLNRMSITVFHSWLADKESSQARITTKKCRQVFQSRQTDILNFLARYKNVLFTSFGRPQRISSN